MNSPCEDCCDRYLGCHSKCEKYKNYRNKLNEINKVNFANREIDYYFKNRFYANKERRFR